MSINHMQLGDQVNGFIVDKVLGEGGFGAVYLVKKGAQRCAIKTELRQFYQNNDPLGEIKPQKPIVLKVEVTVLRINVAYPFQCLNRIQAKHFCTLVDYGQYFKDESGTATYYMIMSLIGKSLEDIRKALPTRKFTMGCALSVGEQCVEAIQEMHSVGFLHRDLKPSNFAIAKDNPRKVVLFDFGLSRRFREKDSKSRRPRKKARYQGTIRYAPLAAHCQYEQSPKDDMEAWMYQQVEITSGHLPWRMIDNEEAVKLFKERSRYDTGIRQLFAGCPKEFVKILRYLDGLHYYDIPNYDFVRRMLRRALVILRRKPYPYDWEESSPVYKDFVNVQQSQDAAEQRVKDAQMKINKAYADLRKQRIEAHIKEREQAEIDVNEQKVMRFREREKLRDDALRAKGLAKERKRMEECFVKKVVAVTGSANEGVRLARAIMKEVDGKDKVVFPDMR